MQKFRYNEEVLKNAYFRLEDSTAKEKVLKLLDGAQDIEFTEDEIALLNKEITCVHITMKDFVLYCKSMPFREHGEFSFRDALRNAYFDNEPNNMLRHIVSNIQQCCLIVVEAV